MVFLGGNFPVYNGEELPVVFLGGNLPVYNGEGLPLLWEKGLQICYRNDKQYVKE